MWHNLSRFDSSSKLKVLWGVSEYKIGCKSIFTSFELQFVNPCAYFTAARVRVFWWCHGDTVNRKWMEMLTRLRGDCLKILNPWKMHSKVQLTKELTISWKSLLILKGHRIFFFARIFLNGTSMELEHLIHHYKYSGSFQFVKRISFDQKSQKSTSISAFMSFTRVLCV